MANKCLTCLLCFGVFLCLITYTLIAPLLPGELIRRDISSIYSGIIMGFYSLISMPVAPLVPKYCYPRLGYMPVYTIGIFTISIANLSYGFLHYLPLQHKGLFIGLNIFVRLFQGMGVAFVYQTCFTLLSLVYKQSLGRVVAFISLATNLGVAVGPTIAGLLYSIFGYVGPFFTLGSILMIFGFITLAFNWDYDPSTKKGNSGQLNQVTYASFCKNKVALVSLIVFFMRTIVITFYEPTLAVKLQLVYGFDSDQSAYFYSLQTAFAFVATATLAFRPIKTNSLSWTSVGLVGAAISIFLMGPSSLLQLPQNIYIMGVGTGLVGIFGSIIGIASIICCAESMKELYEDQDEQITQILGSLRVSLAGLSFLISPFYASTVQNLLSYSILCDSIAVILLLILIAFLWVQRRHKKTKWIEKSSSLREVLLVNEEEEL